MSGATQLIAEVHAFGGAVSISGDHLRIVSDIPLPAELLTRLKAAKLELLEVVRGGGGWDAQDWRYFYDERAAILEYDHGLGRADAERRAFEIVILHWLSANPPRGFADDRCVHCGGPVASNNSVTLACTDNGLHPVIHARCHAPFLRTRRAQAVEALARAAVPKR